MSQQWQDPSDVRAFHLSMNLLLMRWKQLWQVGAVFLSDGHLCGSDMLAILVPVRQGFDPVATIKGAARGHILK